MNFLCMSYWIRVYTRLIIKMKPVSIALVVGRNKKEPLMQLEICILDDELLFSTLAC